MNKIHRTVWNFTLGAYVAAPETASAGRSKGSARGASRSRLAAGAALALLTATAWAGGDGGQGGGFHDFTAVTPGQTPGDSGMGAGGHGGAGSDGPQGARGGSVGWSVGFGDTGFTSGVSVGGRGGDGTASAWASGGGGGGSGIAALGNLRILTGASVTGGAGGSGASGGLRTDGGGAGGGGAGVVTTGVVTVTVSSGATVAGGAGGAGAPNDGGGGGGGAGIYAPGDGGLTIVNAGTVIGGNAGSGLGVVGGHIGGAGGQGEGGAAGATLTSALGGAGIVGANLTVSNNGSISGGLGGDGVTRAAAVQFTGGASSLTLNNANLTGAVVVDAGASARIVAGVDNLTLGNALAIGGAATIDTNGSTLQWAGVISGAGGLGKDGAGTLILSGNNSYSGATTINSGTLQIGAGGAGGAGGTSGTLGTGNVTNNAALAFKRTDTITVANAISGSGTLEQAGTGTTILTGTNSYTGATTVNAGTLQIGNGGTTGTLGTGNVTNNAALAFNRSDTVTVSNAISGSGTLEQAGTGTTILTSANSYSGATTISAGTLQIGNGGTTGTLGSGNVTNNAALAFNRSDNAAVGNAISGSGTLTQAGSGVLTLTGANSYSGDTRITGGTLRAGAANTLSSNSEVNLSGGGKLNLNSFNQTIGSLSGDGGTSVNLTNAALTTQVASGASTYGGVISGNQGSLSKTGAGTLILTGDTTYTGATTISAGTLQLGNGSVTGALNTGAIANNGALVVNRSNAAVLSGDMSGTGTLTQAGTGSLVLLGANSYSGTTTINSGSLQVGAGGTTGTLGSGNVINNGQLSFNRTDALTAANNISGTGTLDQFGAGTLILTGANSYSGATFVTGGTLQVGNGGTSGTLGTGNVTNNAALAFKRSDTLTVANAISGSGTLTQSGSGTTILTGANSYSGGTFVTGGTLQGNSASLQGNIANNAVVNFDQALTGTYGGVLSGSGALNKLGSGNLGLTGANSYSGATTVSAGTLSVNGSIASSAVTVNSGGTLGGNGTVGSTSIASGGVLAPGNSIGTLSVNGNLSFAAGSIYRVEVDATGANDRVNATGGATINGGTVDVQAGAGTYLANTQYTIINAAGGRTGNFAGVTSNLAFLTPTLGYDANNVFLSLARNDINFSAVAITPNQIATSTALQNGGVGASGDMSTVQNALTGLSAAQARAAYDATSGAGIVALRRAGAGFATSFGNQLQARLGAQAAGNSALANSLTSQPVLLAANDRLSELMAPTSDAGPRKFSLAGGAAPSSFADTAGKGLWVRGYGGYGDTDSDGNAAASRVRSSGLSVGFDTQVHEGARLGVAATGGTSRLSTDNNETGKSRGSAVALYGSYASGPWNFSGSAIASWASNHLERAVTVGALSRVASSDFDSNTLAAYGEARYSLPMDGWTLQPLAGLSLSRNKADGFTETGAGALSLQVAQQTINSTRSLLGAKASFDTGRIRLEPRAIWAHEFGDLNTPMTAQFQGAATGSPFQVSGVALKRDTLVLGLGASGNLSKGIDLFADVQAEHNARRRSVALLVSLRSRW